MNDLGLGMGHLVRYSNELVVKPEKPQHKKAGAFSGLPDEFEPHPPIVLYLINCLLFI